MTVCFVISLAAMFFLIQCRDLGPNSSYSSWHYSFKFFSPECLFIIPVVLEFA